MCLSEIGYNVLVQILFTNVRITAFIIDETVIQIANVRITAFIIDETVIQIASNHYFLWIATEPVHKRLC
jgi:transposase-like protein